jgi:hypothetical protein
VIVICCGSSEANIFNGQSEQHIYKSLGGDKTHTLINFISSNGHFQTKADEQTINNRYKHLLHNQMTANCAFGKIHVFCWDQNFQ